jgi:hypothetical protein
MNPFSDGMQYHRSNVSFNPGEDSSHQINMTAGNMTAGSGPEARDKLYRDRIEAMTLDNQSL